MLAAFGGVDVLDHFLGAVGLDDDGDDTGGEVTQNFGLTPYGNKLSPEKDRSLQRLP